MTDINVPPELEKAVSDAALEAAIDTALPNNTRCTAVTAHAITTGLASALARWIAGTELDDATMVAHFALRLSQARQEEPFLHIGGTA